MKITFTLHKRNQLGTNDEAVLISILEHHFQSNSDGFSLFMAPCDHVDYRPGESLKELLGISRTKLGYICKKHKTHYTSKSAFRKSPDKFKGKMYASYYDRILKRVFIFRNPDIVADISLQQDINVNLPPVNPLILSAEQPAIVKNEQPPTGARVPYANSINNTNKGGYHKFTQEDKSIIQKMIDIWNTAMADSIFFSKTIFNKLKQVLDEIFKGSLDAWSGYCNTVASRPFLAGKAKNTRFKACLFWVIKPEIIQRIVNGGYMPFGKSSMRENDTAYQDTYYAIQTKNYEIAAIDTQIEVNRQEVVEAQKLTVNEMVEALPLDEKEKLIDEFKVEFDQKNPIKDKWSKLLFDCQSIDYLRTHFRNKLGYQDMENIQPDAYLSHKRKILIEERNKLSVKLQEIQEVMNHIKKNPQKYKKYTCHNMERCVV